LPLAVFQVQWLHFTGETDNCEIAYVKFRQDFVYENYLYQFIFDWAVLKNNRVAFFSDVDTIRYDARSYFYVCSKAHISQLNLPHVGL